MADKEQIDSCVILELLMEEKRSKERRLLQRRCEQYFYRIAESCNGIVSLPALGEVFKTIYFVADDQKRMTLFNKICDLLAECLISFSTPSLETYKLATKILEFDHLIQPADALRVAEAITAGAALITIDQKLVTNERLENEFGIRIKEPY